MVLNDQTTPAGNITAVGDSLDLSLTLGPPSVSGLLQIHSTPELQSGDDDVVICSPRSFAEARAKARRNHGRTEVIYEESDFQTFLSESTAVSFPSSRGPAQRTIIAESTVVSFPSSRGPAQRAESTVVSFPSSRGPAQRTIIAESTAVSFPSGRGPAQRTIVDGDGRMNVESNKKVKIDNVAGAFKVSPSVPLPEPPSFTCPVCMGPFVEETSTKCGHIFCKRCIVAAIAAQGKCPACRRKLRKTRDTIRVYLPKSD